jgi:hypothetical protein
MIWSEALGSRVALRFFAIDDAGRPRSPSAELVDRDGAVGDVALLADGDGYLVRWRDRAAEREHVLSRKIDARGRPRSDVTASDAVAESAAVASACTDSASGPRCATRRGALELPLGAKITAEQIADDHAAVIAADASGLSLYWFECAAAPAVAASARP